MDVAAQAAMTLLVGIGSESAGPARAFRAAGRIHVEACRNRALSFRIGALLGIA